MRRILVTGAAGFIGFHTCKRLLAAGAHVTGVDNLNDYYRVDLKRSRLASLSASGFEFRELDLADRAGTSMLATETKFDACVHLAAQAGVRYSLENPSAYIDSNLVAFGNVLEMARSQSWGHLVFASSSSVYGANRKAPFSEQDRVDNPINLYAATKKANELMANAYSHLYRLPMTGLRFFTVYGPWGRPDMAVWKFTKAVLDGCPIPVYNHGKMERDFTYIDDIVRGVTKVLASPPGDAGGPPPIRIYNIGNNQPEQLETLIACIERACGTEAKRDLLPMQAGDMIRTSANIDALKSDFGFQPATKLQDGVDRFVDWYRTWTA